MGWFQRFMSAVDGGDISVSAAPVRHGAPRAAVTVDDIAGLAGAIRGGGGGVTATTVLRNAAVYRCVTLIENAIGSLPLGLVDVGPVSGRSGAADHPLHAVLSARPNGWQSPFVFKRLMQHRVLLHGNAYAMVVRSGARVIDLIPLDPVAVQVVQLEDLSVVYDYQRPKGGKMRIKAADMLHLMGPSDDGLRGMSLVSHAADTLGLSLAAQRAAVRLFENGMFAGGQISTDGKLSPQAVANIKATLSEEYQGVANSGKWMVLEEGLKASPLAPTPRDAQQVELLRYQLEEAARLFGVPRPFLMVDDTSWGTGIEQLGLYFVQYGLAPWFVCWEEAINRTCLTAADVGKYRAKFNERALLRGSMKDQAEFFARALGAPGAKGWMTQDEVRQKSDLPPEGGDAAVLAQPNAGSGVI